MKTVELFYLPGCPYCIKADKAIRELVEENPVYGSIAVKWIDESEQTEYADSKDYYFVPTVFFGDEKLYEARPSQGSKEIKANIRATFDRVLATHTAGDADSGSADLIVYGTTQCPDTVACLAALREAGKAFEFRDITELPVLKEFLHYRDQEALFESVKEAGGVGIPFLIHRDGNMSFEW